MSHTLFARSGDLTRIGEVTDVPEMEMLLRHNDVSTWLLRLDGRSGAAALMHQAEGIVLVRDGEPVLSGPVITRRAKQDGKSSTLMLAGVDDTVWLDRRLALPKPLGPPYDVAYDKRSGVAETVLRGYVNDNAGPGATVARQVPRLALAADGLRGADVVGNARFTVLLDLARALAQVGGLGFRVVQVGAGLEFQVSLPVDRTRTARFSLALGNLAGYDYEQTEPSATYAYVAGQGEGATRTIVEGGAADAPYRAETFKDQRDTDDPAALAQSRDEVLADGAASTALSLQPLDTPSVRFGRDYRLGDRVSVTVDGGTIQDVVREVKITLSGDGETLLPVVGTPGASNPDVPTLFDKMRRQARRLSALERR